MTAAHICIGSTPKTLTFPWLLRLRIAFLLLFNMSHQSLDLPQRPAEKQAVPSRADEVSNVCPICSISKCSLNFLVIFDRARHS